MKDLDKTAFSSELTQQHASASQRIRHHLLILQDTSLPLKGQK